MFIFRVNFDVFWKFFFIFEIYIKFQKRGFWVHFGLSDLVSELGWLVGVMEQLVQVRYVLARNFSKCDENGSIRLFYAFYDR